ncbi:hypothetical protein ACE02Y_11215 [Shewanella xiamenensis]|uniref:hypothetical protein n=1 Tax=Shewanella xiamenensis TaxID=332186 RepID=UPI00313AC75B
MVHKDVVTKDSEVKFSEDLQLVSTTDLNGVITYANPGFCQVAGYQLDEMIPIPLTNWSKLSMV